jgi:uncharacterized protein (TIGR00661 family)
LVVPLDWGLGHATRCIPIINTLIQYNCTVILAGEGAVETLLQQEFPRLLFLPLKGYRIRYSKSRLGLPVVMALQIPKIIAAIRREHRWLQAAVREHNIDIVISDNRYGLYHNRIPSIFITHQLLIKTPFGGDLFLQKLAYSYINRFTECWVPDNAGPENLAGALSHPARKPAIPVRYIGPLSRLAPHAALEKYLLILLSGPEPQRTLLEKSLIKEVAGYPGPVVLVRGLPHLTEVVTVAPHVTVHAHLPAAKLGELMAGATFVISRSGYSTVMDIVTTGKKAIFIPTPGQTEQEYLATYLMGKGLAFSMRQKDFNLTAALKGAANFNYKAYKAENSKLEETIINLLN